MTQPPLDFDPKHVGTFLAKIDRDRDTTLAVIAKERDKAVAKILTQAHAEARRVFRHSATDARGRMEGQAARHLARVRSDLRRQRWTILVAAQERALGVIWEKFLAAWQDPDRQWHWCSYWLREAFSRVGDQPIQVICGSGTSPATVERLGAELAQHDGDGQLRVDDDAEPGIIVEWGDYILDGRLRSQCPAIAQEILCCLAHLLVDDRDEDCP
ncbi:MAG: hypothetical protein OES09_00410 [Gammaproteobacteria bacterium]|nr:hypothetical protein [Gammaproteobacteria bacterium]